MDIEQRLRDYAANGCRAWSGIEAVFIEAAEALKAKDDALRPFADIANEAELWGDHGRAAFLANALYLSDCVRARDALSRIAK